MRSAFLIISSSIRAMSVVAGRVPAICATFLACGTLAAQAAKTLLRPVDEKTNRVALEAIMGNLPDRWDPVVRQRYVATQRRLVLEELRKAGKTCDPGLLRWVDADPTRAASIFAAIYPADPRILANLDEIYSKLNSDFLKRRPELFIGAAIARRDFGVGPLLDRKFETNFAELMDEARKNLAKGLDPAEEFAKPSAQLNPEFDAQDKQRFAKVDELLKRTGLALPDAYEKQRVELKTIFGLDTDPNKWWFDFSLGDQLARYLISRGERPKHRSPFPSVAEYFHYLDEVLDTPRESLPTLQKDQPWPRWNHQNAPWPMVAPLSLTEPLDEAKFIVEKYLGKHGDPRFHIYGPYNNGIIAPWFQPLEWHHHSYPSKILSGGVCGPIAAMTNYAYMALGAPTLIGTQPGHVCNITYLHGEDGRFYLNIDHAVAGPDTTYGQWLLDMPAHRIEGKQTQVVRVEHQYALAHAMNDGLLSWLDTRIALRLYQLMTDSQRQKKGRRLLSDTLDRNPYNADAWYQFATDCRTATELANIASAFAGRVNIQAEAQRYEQRSASADLSDLVGKPSGNYENSLASFRDLELCQIGVIASKVLDKEETDPKDLAAALAVIARLDPNAYDSTDDQLRVYLLYRQGGLAPVLANRRARLERLTAKVPASLNRHTHWHHRCELLDSMKRSFEVLPKSQHAAYQAGVCAILGDPALGGDKKPASTRDLLQEVGKEFAKPLAP